METQAITLTRKMLYVVCLRTEDGFIGNSKIVVDSHQTCSLSQHF